MIRIFFTFLLLSGLFYSETGHPQSTGKASFKVVPLGVKGGLDESNLSAYMIAAAGSDNYICADAGTLRFGIDKAISNKVFKTGEATVFRRYIKGYLISHGHLDHVSGLIINSPDDTAKKIYAMQYVIDVLKDKYFTWQSWANFANEGDKPALKKYEYVALEEEKEFPLNNTNMTVRPFELSHSRPYKSTAFLLNSKGNYLLYLGDTGSDINEQSDKLSKVWNYIAPVIKSGRLKGIFIEVSFPDEQPVKQLFGHLTPAWLMQELASLNKLTGGAALRKVPIIITHIKPSGRNETIIRQQLKHENNLRLKIIYPQQGRLLQL